MTLQPWNNPHLLGHEEVERRVMTALSSNRPHHAWILAGKRGIGKATLTYRLARSLLSEDHSTDENSPLFRKIAAKSHPDLLILEPDQEGREEIVAEDARKLSAFMAMKPAESSNKVVIVDSANALNRFAANSILKALEEPTPNTYLFLVCHSLGAILPTIRSRSSLIRLKPPGFSDFCEIMRQTSNDESLVSESFAILYAMSGHSPGSALNILENNSLKAYEAIIKSLDNPSGKAISLSKELNTLLALDKIKNVAPLRNIFQYLASRFIDFTFGPNPEITNDEQSAFKSISERREMQYWLDLIEENDKLLADVERINLDKNLSIYQALSGFFPA